MNNAFDRLVSLVRQGLGFEIGVPPLDEGETEVWSLARDHKVATILAPGILENPASPKMEDEARYLWQLAALREEYYVRALDELAEVLFREGIRIYPLKGVELARSVYPKKGQRAFRDLDLLINPSDLVAADQILRREGFRQIHPRGPLARGVVPQGNSLLAAYRGLDAVAYEKEELFLEMHCTLLPTSLGRYRIEHVWDERRLSPEDFFMHLLFHATRHHFLYGLRQLADLALWAKHKKPNLKVIESKLGREQNLAIAWPAWKLGHTYFPEAILDPEVQPSSSVVSYTQRVLHWLPEMPHRAMGLAGSPFPFLRAKGSLWHAVWGRSAQRDHQLGDQRSWARKIVWKLARPAVLLWRHAPVMWNWMRFYFS